jgi:hypothetical protein
MIVVDNDQMSVFFHHDHEPTHPLGHSGRQLDRVASAGGAKSR